MAETDWHETWRAVLRARFGDRLDAATLDAAAAECEALRAVWAPMAAARPDDGEQPFPGRPLPADGEPLR